MAIKNRSERKKILTVQDVVGEIGEGNEWKGNILQMLAERMFKYSIPIEEVVKNNLTLKFLKELEREIKNEEIISLQINAKPRLAKSTLGLLLGMFIFGLLKKYKRKEEDEEFGMRNVARDQGEKARIMRDPDRLHDIVVTDENNSMEDTGENATVEKAQRDTYSDVQAGRYIHGIFVCPEGTMDKNTDIKLEIRNRERGIIHTRVYYYMKSSMYHGWVLIGVADFDVSELIKNWENVKNRFFNFLKNKNEADRKYIEYWIKRDFYVKYMVKKYEKMELMNREGIMHARDLDYAIIRWNVVDSLKPLAELLVISLRRLAINASSKVESEFRKKAMPLSILGKEEETKRVMGYLNMYRNKAEIGEEVANLNKKLREKKISPQEFNKTADILTKAYQEILKEIESMEETLKRLCKLQEKYNEFEEN